MPNACVPANFWVLLSQPNHPSDNVVAGNICNNKNYRVAALDTSAVAHAHHMPYNGGGAQ
jgi:hypothetical protein